MQEKIKIYTEEDFKGLRKAGALAAETLDYITPFVVPGISTGELDELMDAFIRQKGGISATLGYRGYPKSSCISPNHVICHGIPSSTKILQHGDIINIDITVILDGWYGDTSRMFYIGKPSVKAKRLVETTYACMMAGIQEVKPGATLGDVGYVMEKLAKENRYSVVRDFCGHGIGRVFHDVPNVLNYGERGKGLVLEKGMVFTVEPMVNIGTHQAVILSDGWTTITRDRQLSAQFEHTIGVTETGFEIFTLSKNGWTFPPYV